MASDGTHQRQLVKREANFPEWSPDRRWIAYTTGGFSRAYPEQEIWLMRPDGSAKRQLTRVYPAQAVGLSWSPDGSRIAYARDAHEQGGIWVVNVNGSGATAITNDNADSTPAWAPNGKHLLLTKQCCSASGPQWKQPSTLFIVNANGNNEHRFLKLPLSSCGDQNPAWSPDAQWVAFDRCVYTGPSVGEGERPQRLDIWMVQTNGLRLHRVLANGGEPSWSPDGHWIVFSRTALNGKATFASLYKMRPSGTGVVRLTRDPRGDQAPDW
jgi:Tol biopolymer transport system component